MTPSLKEPASILWVDDDVAGAQIVADLLRQDGVAVDIAPTGLRGLFLAVSTPYELIAVDLRLPDMSGLDVLKALRRHGSTLPAVVVTGFGSVRITVEAMRLGVVDVIEKPIIGDELRALLRHADPARAANEAATIRAGADLYHRLTHWLLNNPACVLEDAAAQLGSDRHTIERLVRTESGRSFREWRRYIEMRHAAALLRASDLPIKAVAYDLGYSSTAAFARAFSAVVGETPTEYRRRLPPSSTD